MIATLVRSRAASSRAGSPAGKQVMRSVIRRFGNACADVVGRFGSYRAEYDASLKDPKGFWHRAANEIEWTTQPTIENTLQQHDGLHRWFSDGMVNTCYNCLDRHVKGSRANQPALVYDSPLAGLKRQYTYAELLDEVSRFAAGLMDLGVRTGDSVVIYMPMVPEAAIAMLACARIGAIHSVVFGGFASKELASRIDDCKPVVVVSSSCGLLPGGKLVEYKPLLDEAIDIAEWKGIKKCVIAQRGGILECKLQAGHDVSYDDLMRTVNGGVDAIPLPSTHPHYILYTSGTTGSPKGVVHDTGGYATALKWTMSNFYDNIPGDTFLAASDIGWVVGHSYTVYGPLLHGCTSVLFEGKPVGTPDAGAYWRLIEEYSVNTLFSAPTAFRAIRQADPKGLLAKEYDLGSLRNVFVAGERSDHTSLEWIEATLNVPAIDHWWQTELGFPGAGNALGLGKIPPRLGACAAAVPGFDMAVFDDNGSELPPGSLGNLAIKLPLPPGCLPTLWNNDERFKAEYLEKFPGYYDTKDAGMIDDEDYIHILARTDDVICTSGYRLSTGVMEEILLEHDHVLDCCVIGVNDKLKGEVPAAFVVVSEESEGLIDELINSVRTKLGAHANLKKVAFVKALPKTRSGKILRGTMRKMANREEFQITPTIEDIAVIDELKPVILKLVHG